MNKRNHLILIAVILCILNCRSFAAILIKTDQNYHKNIQTNLNKAVLNTNNKIKNLHLSNEQLIIQEANHSILAAIKPYGYFHSSITHTINKKDNNTIIYFHIHLGEPVKIKSFKLAITGNGSNQAYFKQLEKNNELSPGNPLNTEAYNKLKDEIYTIAIDNGYFDTTITNSEINIDLNKNTAHIDIKAKTGMQYTIGNTTFTKNYYDTSFLRKFLAYNKGDKYSTMAMNSSQDNFLNSPYFTQAIIIPVIKDKNEKKHQVPIKVALVQNTKQKYSVGVGYDKMSSWHIIGAYTNNRVNNKGKQFNTQIQLAKSEKNISAKYTFPSSNPVNSYNTISIGMSKLTQPNGSSKAAKIKLSKNKTTTNSNTAYSLNILKERYNLIGLPKTTADLIYPSINWNIHNTHDLNGLSQTGYSSSISIAGAPNEIAHTKGFFQAIASTHYLFTLPNHKTRIVARASIAKTFIKNILTLPLSMQLYAGGSGSIRGYSYHSLPGGDPGRNLYTASIEAQQKIYKQIYLTAFYDIGNVSNNSNIFKNSKAGAGTGIAFVSSIGTFELSIAKPITPKIGKWKIQFSMEPNI